MTWALACLSLWATWLNARKVRLCFALWFVTNICWAFVNVAHEIYARAALDGVYALLAVYGWRNWRDAA